MAGNDFKKFGDSIKRGLGKAGETAQKGFKQGWKDIEPKLRKGSNQVGRTASAAFEELGTSIRKFAERVRERSSTDESRPAEPPATSAPADVVDADVEPDDKN